MNMSGPSNSSDPSSDINFDNLYPAIVECFVIILSGYVAGRMNLISPSESKGINTFVGHFSLPAMIFLSMATLDFSVVNWMFLLSILISKTVVFLAVIIITIIVSRPVNLGKAGIYAIFSTQSNDFALGYPIVAALYANSHPDYANYLYLVAPISLVFLNPLGFVLMEIEKRKSVVSTEGSQQSRAQVALHIARGVLLNPVVLMTVAGVVGNYVFQHCLPSILEGVLKVLGSAFSATSLFILGLRMVGQISNLSGKGLVVPGILVVVKTIVVPLVTREMVNLLKAGSNATETLDLSTYGFLYGTFPTAPGVFVYAGQYNLDVDLIATSMVACTFFSAPIMFVSAKMITLHVTNDTDYLQDLNKFLFNISIIGIISCVWSTATFLLSKKWKKVPHCMTLCLVISQLVACIGALLWDVLECKHGWQIHLQFIMFTIGVFSSRIWTALLAISLLLLRWRSLCFTLRMRPVFAIIGWGIPAALVTILCLLEERESTVKEKTDPNFQYGRTQATTACLVLLCSFVVTALALVLHQRYNKRHAEYSPLLQEDKLDADDKYSINADNCGESVVRSRASTSQHDFTVCRGSTCKAKKDDSTCCLQDVEDICFNPEDEITPLDGSLFSPTGDLCPTNFNCDTSQRQKCSTEVKKYRSYQTLTEPEEMTIVRDRDDEYQVLRHVVLLLLLCLSMLVGFALCMWKLIMEEASGIYVELEFLDGALNFGQGLFVFIIFGLDAKLIVLPFIKWWRKFWYGAETILLPTIEELTPETRQICDQFMNYHYEKCIQDLVRDRRWRMKSYDSVFCGNELVDWLLIVGLAHDRSEAIKYGRHLLSGRIIRHAENQHHFFDLPYFYVFIALENTQQTLHMPSSTE
ncbi:hypothetical protein CHUAL_008706 [Chamberlinius hualienensis]